MLPSLFFFPITRFYWFLSGPNDINLFQPVDAPTSTQQALFDLSLKLVLFYNSKVSAGSLSWHNNLSHHTSCSVLSFAYLRCKPFYVSFCPISTMRNVVVILEFVHPPNFRWQAFRWSFYQPKPDKSVWPTSGAPNENTVQNHLNIALLNVF